MKFINFPLFLLVWCQSISTFMVISASKILKEALGEITFVKQKEFLVHEEVVPRNLANTDEILSRYANAKEKVIKELREYYFPQHSPAQQFALENWLLDNSKDEVAYFLNEAGSNALNYSEFKIPAEFHLWLGNEGFIIGIEQRGKGFDVEEVLKNKKIKRMNKLSGGKGFSFFKKCKSTVFFDDFRNARVIYFYLHLKRTASFP